ncbi:putative reverse transcriptase domain-containing protein [Tanacetum coccineum]
MFVGALIIFTLHDFVQIGGWFERYGFWIVANVDGNSDNGGADLAIPLDSVNEISKRFANALNGYFIGKRLAFSIVENYVKNTWAKYGIKRVMLHSIFFFFQFSSRKGMEQVLEIGPWLIRLIPIILNIWTPNARLKKDEIKTAPVWVQMYSVPIVAYSETVSALFLRIFPKAVRKAESTKAYDYRPANGNDEASTFQLNTNKVAFDLLPDRIGKKEQELNLFSLKNSFDSLSKEDNVFEFNNDKGTVTDELASSILKSDSEEVEEVFVEKDLSIEPMDEWLMMRGRRRRLLPRRRPRKLYLVGWFMRLMVRIGHSRDKCPQTGTQQNGGARGRAYVVLKIPTAEESECGSRADEKNLDDIRVVRDFPEVFPEDLLDLPLVREIEFRIDLIQGASPVCSRSPYRRRAWKSTMKTDFRLTKKEEVVESVKNWKTPESSTEIHSFLGLADYYRRFIENFSKIAKPLTLLTQKNKAYVWGDKQDEAFQILKEKLCNAPVLALPRWTDDFVVFCVHQKQGFGRAMMQRAKC